MNEEKIIIIGSRGHYKYALDGLSEVPNPVIAGIAPGEPREDVGKLRDDLGAIGLTPDVFQNYQTMLDDIEPTYAVINSRFDLQAELAAEVLKRGINAFVEKPLATTLSDLAALDEAHEQSTASLVTMLGLRYKPHFYTAWNSVRNGAVGDIRLINVQKSYKLKDRAKFYKSRKTFGGTIPWVGIHGVDLIQWFSGRSFVEVDARHSTKKNRDHGDLETTGLCMFTLENEILASLTIDYLRPGAAESHGDDRIRVVGSDGIIEVIHEKAFLINSLTQGTRELPLENAGNIFADFVRGASGRSLLTAEESFEATRISLLARQSADQQRSVSCGEQGELK